MSKLTAIIACVITASACAGDGRSDTETLTLEEENPALWELLQRTRQEGRRPTPDEFAAIGGVRVAGTPAKEQPPMTKNSDMQVATPNLYYFPDSNMYIADSFWYWNIDEAAGEYGWVDDGRFGEIGGEDAFGLHYSRPIVDIYSDTALCPYNWEFTQGWGHCPVTDTTRKKADEQNVVHTHQEEAGSFGLAPGINMALGDIVHVFRPIGTECIQAWATYVHTYDDTQINGISLGPWSLGIQWAPAEGGWEKTSFGSTLFCP